MYEYKALLKRVVDGDTIDVYVDLGFSITMEMRLRLADIDTPELRSKDEAEREAAQAAKKFVEDYIGNNPLLIRTRKTSSGKERTTFGRFVADIWVVRTDTASGLGLNPELKFLNQVIVEEGHGKVY